MQLFKLQSSEEAKELTLIRELQRISYKLLAYDKTKEKVGRKDVSYAPEKAIASKVSSIKSAVSFGLQTSNFYMTIHEELSSVNVLQMVDVMGKVQHPELLIGSENIYSVFLVDLAVTSGISTELSSSLLDSANKSWVNMNAEKDFETKSPPQKKISLIRGNFQVLSMMNCLVKEFITFFKENDEQSDLYSVFWPAKRDIKTLPQILTKFVGNLNHVRFKEEVDNWKSATLLMKELTVLLDEEESNQEKGVLAKDIKQENKLHMAYKRLSRTLRSLRDWSSRTVSLEITHYNDYLSKLFIHLRQVTTAALECKTQNTSSGTYRLMLVYKS